MRSNLELGLFGVNLTGNALAFNVSNADFPSEWIQDYAPELSRRCRRELRNTNRSWRVRPRLARNTAGSGLGPWYLARAKALSVGLANAYFKSLGLPSLLDERRPTFSNRPVRTRMQGGVAGVGG